jgi:amidohydrolase
MENQFITFRKTLHSIAELSKNEKKTSEFLINILEKHKNGKLYNNIGDKGILFQFKGKKPGPSILFRADMDGLPIEESIKIPHGSNHENVSHKCGHDGHMAILLSVADYLNKYPVKKGSVSLVFQQAEETGEGAQMFLSDPIIKDKHFDYVFALHNLPGFPLGSIILKNGVFASASTGIAIYLKGKSSHASQPELGKSPALAVAQLIQNISSLTQFNLGLGQNGKATIIHAKVGEEAFGTSPALGCVMTTLRSYEDDVLLKLQKEIFRQSKLISDLYKLEVKTEVKEPFPSTKNSDECVNLLKQSANNLGYKIIYPENPFPWSEDFGHFTKKFKGALWGIGGGLNCPPLHNFNYDFPDEIIEYGVNIYKNLINQLLGN